MREIIMHPHGHPSYTFYALFLEMRIKQRELLSIRNEVDTLFIGNSQIAYGIIPKYYAPSAFNLGSNSLDMFYVYHICRYWRKRLPMLKKIFLGYSFFSRAAILNDGRDSEFYTYLKYMYHIDCDLFIPEKDEKKHKKNFDRLMKEPITLSKTQNGFLYPPDPGSFPDRAIRHYKISRRPIPAYLWIAWLARELKKENIELCILILPARRDYRSQLPPKEQLYKEVYSLSSDIGFPILDFWDDPLFEDEDFYDTDHLNLQGAEKLTKRIKTLA